MMTKRSKGQLELVDGDSRLTCVLHERERGWFSDHLVLLLLLFCSSARHCAVFTRPCEDVCLCISIDVSLHANERTSRKIQRQTLADILVYSIPFTIVSCCHLFSLSLSFSPAKHTSTEEEHQCCDPSLALTNLADGNARNRSVSPVCQWFPSEKNRLELSWANIWLTHFDSMSSQTACPLFPRTKMWRGFLWGVEELIGGGLSMSGTIVVDCWMKDSPSLILSLVTSMCDEQRQSMPSCSILQCSCLHSISCNCLIKSSIFIRCLIEALGLLEKALGSLARVTVIIEKDSSWLCHVYHCWCGERKSSGCLPTCDVCSMTHPTSLERTNTLFTYVCNMLLSMTGKQVGRQTEKNINTDWVRVLLSREWSQVGFFFVLLDCSSRVRTSFLRIERKKKKSRCVLFLRPVSRAERGEGGIVVSLTEKLQWYAGRIVAITFSSSSFVLGEMASFSETHSDDNQRSTTRPFRRRQTNGSLSSEINYESELDLTSQVSADTIFMTLASKDSRSDEHDMIADATEAATASRPVG